MGNPKDRKCRLTLLLKTLAVLMLLFTGSALATAQSVTVKGTVTSAADGEPLIGATVIVKGTSTGIATDIDGNYSVNAQNGATLIFSYVGYASKEVKVTSNRLDVALAEDSVFWTRSWW